MFYLFLASISVPADDAARATFRTPAAPTIEHSGSNSLDPLPIFLYLQ